MKKFTIISDSCCDLKQSEFNSEKFDFITVPLSLNLDDKVLVDDESLDTTQLLKQIKGCKKVGTACPSPERFYDEFKNHDNIICITLSAKLSGTYNSARLAAEKAIEENPEKRIFILDGMTASAGEAWLVHRLAELIESEEYSDFDDVAQKMTELSKKCKTKVLLQDYGVLAKTGRISKIVGLIASVLTLRTICGDNGAGEIKVHKKVLGPHKALKTLGHCLAEKTEAGESPSVVISHCNNETDAGILEKLLQSVYNLKNIIVKAMRGTACLYGSDKGISMAY